VSLAYGPDPRYRQAMGFPRRLLAEGEELVLDLRPHWIALVLPVAETVLIAVGVILALAYLPDSWPTWVRWGIVLVGLILFAILPGRLLLDWATSHFVVTSDRVIHRSGWFAKQSMEIPLENINDVRFNQTVFERVIGAGDLTLESAGEFGQQIFSDIRDPERVQKVIYETSEANQRRMVSPSAAPSSADELAKLDRLRDEGVLTDDEFDREKRRLLGEP
jgi:uncharacterized membrane protein YdbT with pleckstrin-like domain